MAGQPASPRVLLDVPITYDVGDRLIHAPMVAGTVRGVPTRLILDTGSSDHVLTRELADRAALPARPGEPGTDGTGASVPSWTLGDVPLAIDGVSFDLHDVVAIDGPPPFAGWGVGGFLSPQHLHPTAWVVLDLAGARLILLAGGTREVADWLAARRPGMRLVRLERVAGDATILVRAALAPFDAVVTLLDSGGKSTEVVAGAVPGLEGGSRVVSGHGVGGDEIAGSGVEAQTLVVGEATVAIPRLIVRDAMDGQDALVGMNVLAGTVLAVRADRTQPVLWLVPGPVTADGSG